MSSKYKTYLAIAVAFLVIGYNLRIADGLVQYAPIPANNNEPYGWYFMVCDDRIADCNGDAPPVGCYRSKTKVEGKYNHECIDMTSTHYPTDE